MISKLDVSSALRGVTLADKRDFVFLGIVPITDGYLLPFHNRSQCTDKNDLVLAYAN